MNCFAIQGMVGRGKRVQIRHENFAKSFLRFSDEEKDKTEMEEKRASLFFFSRSEPFIN